MRRTEQIPLRCQGSPSPRTGRWAAERGGRLRPREPCIRGSRHQATGPVGLIRFRGHFPKGGEATQGHGGMNLRWRTGRTSRGRPERSPWEPLYAVEDQQPAGEPESPTAECTVRRTRRFGRSMPTRLRPRALRVRGRLETEPGGDERPLHRGRHWRPRPARAYIPPRQLRREADPDGSDWDLR